MLRVIFDTNIYGHLIEEKDIEAISQSISKDKDFIVYGFKPIRKELRNTPKNAKLRDLSKRRFLLNLYDDLTRGKCLENSAKIRQLTLKFYKAYRKFGGIKNWEKSNIHVDFTIVACACFYKLDVVISNDCKTMLNKAARKAYKHVVLKESLWMPNFWKYSDLRKRYVF